MRWRQDQPSRARQEPPVLDLLPLRARIEDAWRRGREPGGLKWLERAHRLAPSDQNLCFALAAARLQAGQHAAAAALLEPMAQRFGGQACWTALAVARIGQGQLADAAAAISSALGNTAPDDVLAGLAAMVASRLGRTGWCGVQPDGVLLGNRPAATLTLRLDGETVTAEPGLDGRPSLPERWRQDAKLDVFYGNEELLGSPIALTAIRHVEGVVSREDGCVKGYAWQPASPGRDPLLRIVRIAAGQSGPGTEMARFTATELADVDGSVPMVRPRSFAWPVPDGATIHVLDEDGRDLLGSPLPPDAGPDSPQTEAVVLPGSPRRPDVTVPVDVVIPVYRGLRATLDCLATVMDSVSAPNRILVVNDASPDAGLVAALTELAAQGRIELIASGPGGANRGFPAAVNAGLRASAGHHVILLNSDTLVAAGWLETLRDAACSHADIGTATPLSNEASIFSYPDVRGGNPAPDRAGTEVLASLAASANGGRLVDVPTAHGFCMFIRADCLAETGLFDEATFAQGYGEENDFSERARALGWRHVAVPAVFVAHLGGVSFGGAGAALLARNLAILNRRYPDYAGRVADHVRADPLAPARRRLDAARWRARAAAPRSVLLITHGGGGGTARIVAERADAVRARGFAPVVLRAVDGLCEVSEPAGDTPNLAFALPRELGALARLLAEGRPDHAELHHLLGHDHSVMRVLATLGLPYDIWVHDYGWFCARLSFVTGEGRFCGEADTATCVTCLARWGRGIDDPVSPASLRRRSAADFRRARSVVVPSSDVARRVERHVPGLVADVQPWETDPVGLAASVQPGTGPVRIAVVGAIGLEKGFDILLACAQDAEARGLDVMFTVIGYTVDDDALLVTGKVFITGEFKRLEAAGLIREQGAHLAFLPSIWPETWCYALTDVWAAGLSAAVFDIGTPADRVRRSGGGWVLPLSLPARNINDWFIATARLS
jgi:GT2 family glycosyltransferase